MKKYLIFIICALFFVSCATPNKSLPPVANAYKFTGIEYHHKQKHNPKKFIYQSKEQVEKKYNEQILEALSKENLLDQSSDYELKIIINHRREFVGEATPFKSDRIGNIFVSYDIQIVRNGEVLRHYSQGSELRYNPGIFGSLKTIAMQNTDDTLENDAILAMTRQIIKHIKK